MKRILRSGCLAILLGLLPSIAVAGGFLGGPRKYVYHPFEFPGAISTVPFGLNDRGDVVGFYRDASGGRHGFKYVNGTFNSIDISGLTGVTPRGINNLRDIVGNWADANGNGHGLILTASGQLQTLDAPGAVETAFSCIDDRRQIVGVTIDQNGIEHGVRFQNGTFTPFDIPELTLDVGFFPCVNNAGTLIATGDGRAVILSNGLLMFLTLTSLETFTSPQGISNRGDIVGTFAFTTSDIHGFLWSGGVLTAIEYPGAPVTQPHAINVFGTIVGEFRGADGVRHGFIARPADP